MNEKVQQKVTGNQKRESDKKKKLKCYRGRETKGERKETIATVKDGEINMTET